MTPPRDRLSLRRCLLGSVLVPWKRRTEFANAIGVPLAALLAVTGIWSLSAGLTAVVDWLVWALYGLLAAIVAVRLHRLVLLGERPRGLEVPRWSQDTWHYLLMLFAVWTAYLLTAALVISLLSLTNVLATREAEDSWMSRGLAIAGVLPAAWLAGRLLLALPAAAIGKKWDLAQAWRASRGNGWRLAIIGLGVPWAVKAAVHAARRADATLIEWWLLAVVSTVAVALQVTALSLAFAAVDSTSTKSQVPASSGPRLLRGQAPVAALLLGIAAFVGMSVYSASGRCAADATLSDWSPDRQYRVEYRYQACLGDLARVELWLYQGNTAVQLQRFQLPLEADPRGTRHPVGGWQWHWHSESELQIRRPAVGALDGPPTYRGVEIQYVDSDTVLTPRPRR